VNSNDQTTSTTTATDTESPAGNAPRADNDPYRYNRRTRRAMRKRNQMQATFMRQQQNKRLEYYKVIQEWKQRSNCTPEQQDSVFRVALSKLFKANFEKEYKTRGDFERQLMAIVRNVKKGFKYKADVVPATETAAT
jgi:hypothetical protein